MDGIEPEKITEYKESLSNVEGIAAVNDVKARVSGNKMILDVTVTLNTDLTSREKTEAIDKAKTLMKKQHNSLITLMETRLPLE